MASMLWYIQPHQHGRRVSNRMQHALWHSWPTKSATVCRLKCHDMPGRIMQLLSATFLLVFASAELRVSKRSAFGQQSTSAVVWGWCVAIPSSSSANRQVWPGRSFVSFRRCFLMFFAILDYTRNLWSYLRDSSKVTNWNSSFVIWFGPLSYFSPLKLITECGRIFDIKGHVFCLL